MADWVLDASAVIAFLNQEPGGDFVGERIHMGVITAVNLSEVASVWLARSQDVVGTEAFLEELPCEIANVGGELGIRAGLMIAQTRSRGLSLGDRICLAYAERVGLPVLTADRPWADLDIGVDVRLIR
jgi:PIN domain nuclease of toxin-antitoxin system